MIVLTATVAALPPLPADVVSGAMLYCGFDGKIGPPNKVNTVSDAPSESGKVAFDGDTDGAEDWAEASVKNPTRAMEKQLAILLATVDAAMATRKERL